MLRCRALFLVLLMFAAGCVAPAPADEPVAAPGPDEEPATGSGNRLLAEGPRPFSTPVAAVSTGAEPTMLVDSLGRWLWIGDTRSLHRSSDGGVTWERVPAPFPLSCDGLSMAQSDDGILHVTTTGCPNIMYARTSDGGQTWDHTDLFVDVAPIADRPWIATRGENQVAILHYDFGRGMSEACVASDDGGNTWMSRSTGLAPLKAGNALFAPDGSLLYANAAGIHRFAEACSLTVTTLAMPRSGQQVMVQLGLDGQVRPYVALPAVGNDRMLIRAFSSLAPGSPMKEFAVSPPELRSNTFGAISVHGNEIAVAWYGSESPGNPASDGFSGEWNVFVARVTDFWTTSPQVRLDRITTEPNHVDHICMGGAGCTGGRELLDYFGIDHDADGNLHIAYGHTQNNGVAVHYAFLDA